MIKLIKESQGFPKPPQQSSFLANSTKINIFNEQNDVPINVQSAIDLVSYFLRYWEISTDEVSVYFLSDPSLARLHDEVFSDPSLTDTITLPMDGPWEHTSPHILGEAFVSPKAAVRFLGTSGLHLLYEEISRYVVHSLLHMLGYDDQTEEEKKEMRTQENRTLCMLRENNALLTQ